MLESLSSSPFYYYCSTCMHTEYCLSGTELVSGNMGLSETWNRITFAMQKLDAFNFFFV